jgi:LacI family transcriptional regulator
MVTIVEIASKLGLSKSTVSRVINNDPHVKAETRENVWQMIKELDYTPNFIARSMIKGSLPLVLVITGDIQNHYFAKMITGIEKALTEKEYMSVVYNSKYDPEQEKKLIKMTKHWFAGIIPLTSGRDGNLEECLADVDCPVVLINRENKKLNVDEVCGDDFNASYKATKELIDNGHRRIGYLSSARITTVSTKRLLGYCTALEDNGIPVDNSLIVEGNLDMASGYKLGEILLTRSSVTAICCNAFLMALGVARYGRTVGKAVSVDFDVACCECVPELYEKANFVYAGSDLEAMGEKAASILLKRIEKHDAPIQKICFPANKVYNPKKGVSSGQ